MHQTADICSNDICISILEAKKTPNLNEEVPNETRKQLLYEFTENVVKRSTLDQKKFRCKHVSNKEKVKIENIHRT